MGYPDAASGVNARTVVVVAAAVVLVAAQAGLVAFVLGVGPFDSGTAGREPAAPQSSGGDGSGSAGTGGSGAGGGSGGGGSGSGSSAGSGDGSAEAGEPPPYDLDVLGTEQCGNTCRDVTVRLTNNRNATATDVTVRTRIYAGNTTGENARVWSGRNEVGTLEAGGSTTATARVSLSYFEAIDVKRKGGWVTIVTTVESAETTRSFRERRQVV